SPILNALSQRAGVRAMLGRFDDALMDCDRVLSEIRDHELALWNKGFVLLQKDETKAAIECFENLKESSKRKGLTLPLANAYYDVGHYDKVVAIIEPEWKPIPGEREFILLADVLLRAYTALGKTTEINRIIQSIKEVWGDDTDALIMIARQNE